jgi:RHS repeat-associated protein
MPGRRIVGGYRYQYQGQEVDPETGKEAFQLRLWDSRIGRWLSPDPYSQYHSPYNGMGNDPINGIDPDGGYRTKWERFWGWVGGGFKGSFTGSGNGGTPEHNYGIIKRGDDSITWDFGLNKGGGQRLLDYGYKDNGVNFYNPGSGFMRATQSNIFADIEGILKDRNTVIIDGTSKFALSTAYSTVDNVYTFVNVMLFQRKNARTLSGKHISEGKALSSMFSTISTVVGGKIFTGGGNHVLNTMTKAQFRRHLAETTTEHITKQVRKEMFRRHNSNVEIGKQLLSDVSKVEYIY